MTTTYPVKSYNGSEYLDSFLYYSSGGGEITLRYELGDIKIAEVNTFPFVALVNIRLKLEPVGVKILCNGCRVDVYPSGAALVSVKAYRLEMGQPATRESLVKIFEPTDDIDKIATVEEQREFWKNWLEDRRFRSTQKEAE